MAPQRAATVGDAKDVPTSQLPVLLVGTKACRPSAHLGSADLTSPFVRQTWTETFTVLTPRLAASDRGRP